MNDGLRLVDSPFRFGQFLFSPRSFGADFVLNKSPSRRKAV